MKVCVMGMPFVPCRIGQVLGIFPVTAFCFCFGFVKNGGQFIGKAGKIEAVKKGKSKQGDKKRRFISPPPWRRNKSGLSRPQ